MIETIVGSTVIAALITGIITIVVKRIDRDREDLIRREERAEARKDREEERRLDREDHAADALVAERQARADKEAERLSVRAAAGRAQSQVLLSRLEDLQKAFALERPGPFSTHTHRGDLYLPIASVTRLVPDADFREFIDLSMQVISGLWVRSSVGDGPEDVSEEQRRLLAVSISQVGRFITDDGWDRGLLGDLRATKDVLDGYWDEYHKDAPKRPGRSASNSK